jgi:hypothetical protein
MAAAGRHGAQFAADTGTANQQVLPQIPIVIIQPDSKVLLAYLQPSSTTAVGGMEPSCGKLVGPPSGAAAQGRLVP